MLKANLHLHTSDDPIDAISYTAYQAIDYAKELEFQVLAITCHGSFVFKEKYETYAKQKDILLIPGIESFIEGKHVIILNCDKEVEDVKTFKELRIYKNKKPQIFILAPHPFVLSGKSLGKKLIENIELFDAIELTIFSNRIFNFNKKAEKIAKKYLKPLVATSDCHSLKYLKRGHTFIDAKTKTIQDVLNAIRKGKLKNQVSPMAGLTMLKFKMGFFSKYD